MSTATLTPPRMKPRSRLLTAEDLATLPEEINGQAVKYELFDGELVIMAPPAGGHSVTSLSLNAYLLFHAQHKGLGKAFDEIGVLLRRKPDRVVGADGAFVLEKSLPVNYSKQGWLITIPEIIVEVRSKNDSMPEVVSKVEEYLEAGSVLVWVPDPRHKTVTEYRRDASPVVFKNEDMLVCDLLPGFAVPVKNLFDD
jgi:Uma2 family endonuclease